MSNRVKAYTPSWLSKPAPGHTLFAASADDLKSSVFSPFASKKKSRPGPRRTIARRGTEVFVAVNREIRWGDLVYLKDSWIENTGSSHIKKEESNGSFLIYDDETRNGTEDAEDKPAEGYRVIKTPVADEIRQLIISPNSNYLAVLTTHTVHICVLPDSSHLTAQENIPLKPKFFTLGPTTHVTSKSAVMSTLWHPLGVKGSSLVTVTEDAVVRVWEISPTDRWSFDSPTLAVDLKKLANGVSLDQDFSASTTNTNTAFSPDMFDMEVAAASFAARGSGLWSSMTLFVAMRAGDVYALCPLLPQLWAPPPALIPSLSISIVAKLAAIEDDPTVSSQEKLLTQQQLEWMSDLDNQEPRIIQDSLGEQPVEVYRRPSRPGSVPRLQGPLNFEMDPNEDEQDDLDLELADIYVIGRKLETDELMLGEDEILELDENEQEGLSLTVICLLSTSGQVRVCLDMEGIEAKWLPRTKSRPAAITDVGDSPCLLTYETIDILELSEVTPDCWPVFSDDATSRYSFFITHNSGITEMSLSPWVFRLEAELNGEPDHRSDFRIGLIADAKSHYDRLYVEPPPGNSLAACAAIRDPDLGYFILSATPSDPVALILESPEDELAPVKRSSSPSPFYEHTPEQKAPLEVYTPRPAFQPSPAFDQPSYLPQFRQGLITSKYVALMQQQIRLSPATLKIFTTAHQILSQESGRLNEAVSELFRRCDALRSELKEEIIKANELKGRIDRITGGDDDESPSDDARLTRALAERKRKQDELMQRFENLRKKIHQRSSRELSDKEKAWAEEVRRYDQSLSEPNESDKGAVAVAGSSKALQPLKRLQEIKALKDELVGQVAEVQGKDQQGDERSGGSPASSVSNLRIPSELRKAKVSQVMGLLDRETALVEALQDRLERMSVG
ncbi:Nucleoporin NUP82 [Cytospora mali]|uniref:Nucleoporin NUP82 n=1 Tax=Cytospora mali TaxID=578113 RepID=A0A194V4H2_CYTMA|nr:Nucleoporin NUP82 [Valsa mali var. pyri (nom. inval.)]